jgi:hypothetical protein
MVVGALFGQRGAADKLAQPLTAKRFGPANDNGPKEPVKTVTVRRTLEKSGVAIKVKVPVDEFIGVAVSTAISEDGILSSAIELVHGDPELNYRVFEEIGNASVVAEWQNWGRKLRLPLFIKAGDGDQVPESQQVDGVALGMSTAAACRRGGRRPRFSTAASPAKAPPSQAARMQASRPA